MCGFALADSLTRQRQGVISFLVIPLPAVHASRRIAYTATLQPTSRFPCAHLSSVCACVVRVGFSQPSSSIPPYYFSVLAPVDAPLSAYLAGYFVFAEFCGVDQLERGVFTDLQRVAELFDGHDVRHVEPPLLDSTSCRGVVTSLAAGIAASLVLENFIGFCFCGIFGNFHQIERM